MQRSGKRRKRNEPESAGLDWARSSGTQAQEAALKVQGLAATLFEGGVHDPEEHLITWQGTPGGAEVDRFDGRLLLEDLTPIPDRTLPNLGVDEPDEAGLDEERYADLDPSRESEVAGIAGWYHPTAASSSSGEEDEGEENARREMPSFMTGASVEPLSAVRYTYGDSNGVRTPAAAGGEPQDPDAAVEGSFEPFQPDFAVPESLAAPKTQRMHKIIAQTAKFVRGAGRQSVFVLRVKQVGNPNLAFLEPGHPLHPYFQWLIDHPPAEVMADSTTAEGQGGREVSQATLEELSNMPGGPRDAENALGLLTSYGSDTPKSGGAGSAFSEPSPASPLGGSAEAANPSPQRPPPPPEVLAIIGKLVKFVQSNGPKLEASVRQREKDNPRFAFLHPGHAHHHFYREQLIGALGKEQAESILPPDVPFEASTSELPNSAETVPSSPASAWLPFSTTRPTNRAAAPLPAFQEEETTSSANAPRMADQQTSGHAKTSGIRANPAFVKVAKFPMTADKAAGRTPPPAEADSLSNEEDLLRRREDPSDPALATQSDAENAPSEQLVEGGDSTQPSRQMGDAQVGSGGDALAVAGASLEMDELERGEDVDREANATALSADEAKKAHRRRLAQQLLAAKKQQEMSARLKLANKIINHRSAFLADDDQVPAFNEKPEPGEIVEAEEMPARPPAPAPLELPKLEDLLRAKRKTLNPVLAFDGVETLPRQNSPEHRKANSKHETKKRHKEPGSDEEGSQKEVKRRRRNEGDGSSGSEDSSENAGRGTKGRSKKGKDEKKRKKEGKEKRSRKRESRSPDRKGSRQKEHKQHKSKKKEVQKGRHERSPVLDVGAKDMEERIRAMLRGQAQGCFGVGLKK